MQALAGIALPFAWKPDRGSVDSYSRICEQGKIQVEARENGNTNCCR
jgi:hypothetical protein